MPADASLAVVRTEFIELVRLLTRNARRMKGAQAVLSFNEEEDVLTVDIAGVRGSAAAQGEWPGRARIGAPFLLALAKSMPAGDPLLLQVRDGRLVVGDRPSVLSIDCAWSEGGSPSIRLPLNPTRADILALRFRYTSDEIAAAGLTRILQKTEDARDTAIAWAAQALAEFGVTADDLHRLADEALRRSVRDAAPDTGP